MAGGDRIKLHIKIFLSELDEVKFRQEVCTYVSAHLSVSRRFKKQSNRGICISGQKHRIVENASGILLLDIHFRVARSLYLGCSTLTIDQHSRRLNATSTTPSSFIIRTISTCATQAPTQAQRHHYFCIIQLLHDPNTGPRRANHFHRSLFTLFSSIFHHK